LIEVVLGKSFKENRRTTLFGSRLRQAVLNVHESTYHTRDGLVESRCVSLEVRLAAPWIRQTVWPSRVWRYLDLHSPFGICHSISDLYFIEVRQNYPTAAKVPGEQLYLLILLRIDQSE
jgi:hypothetical protein